MLIFPDLPDFQVEEVEVAFEITLTLRTTSPMAPCPSCGTPSSHIQSRYTRTLRDLPSSGRPIRLIMHVRRFFCKESACAQKIFGSSTPRALSSLRAAHQSAARSPLPAWPQSRRPGRSRRRKRAGPQRQSRYHLAFGSSPETVGALFPACDWCG